MPHKEYNGRVKLKAQGTAVAFSSNRRWATDPEVVRAREAEHNASIDRVRDEIVVPLPINRGKPPCPGVGPNDEIWDRVYSTSFKRMVRYGRVIGVPFMFRAMTCADFVCWSLLPPSMRPEDWPRTFNDFALAAGQTPWTLRAWFKQARVERFFEKPLVSMEEKVRELDDALQNAALVALQRGGKDAAGLVTAYYKRMGRLQSVSVTNVQVGDRLVLNGAEVDPKKWLERARKLIPYVEVGVGATEGNEHEGQVEPGADESDSQQGEDDDGREVRSEERDGSRPRGGSDPAEEGAAGRVQEADGGSAGTEG